MIDADRLLRSYTDVLAVEYREEEGMARVVTMGDAYVVDVREHRHQCPDREYNLDGGLCKHLAPIEALSGKLDLPTGWLTVEDLDRRPEPVAVTDGGQVQQAEKWVVVDHDNDNERTADSIKKAKEMKATAEEFGSENVEIIEPGPSQDQDDAPAEAEVVAEISGEDQDTDIVADPEEAKEALPDRTVTDDPIHWLERNGDHFIDYVGDKNVPAINRKGFEVLSHFYDIDVHTDLEVTPEETDFQHARAKARAVTPGGRVCEAFGTAHVGRGPNGDPPEMLVEFASTRAKKRALSIATGVGAIAVEELKNGVEQ